VELWYFKEHWEHRPRVTLYGTRNLSSDHAGKSFHEKAGECQDGFSFSSL
jgi:hypothetical protein